MLYHHISGKKRRQIEELVQAGNSNKTIAARLWRSQSTIGREIRRNTAYGGRGYFSKRAQELALARRQNSKVPKISEKTWAKVFELYNLDLSPEQIASQVKISHESIYRRIYAEIKAGKLDRKHLRWCRKKRRRRLPKRPLGTSRKHRLKNAPISALERNSVTGKAIRSN